MRIVFSGGGTLGSTTPLLALFEELKRRGQKDFLWLGTRFGPEKELVEEWGIPFKAIFSGKWRRYFSWRNFFDPFFVFLGFLQSLYFLKKFKGDCLLTAGGFVAVPVALAAYCLKIPIFVHQQDLEWGLANRLMSYLAKGITVSFGENLKSLPFRLRKKALLTGNPCRDFIRQLISEKKEKNLLLQKFHLEEGVPVVLVLGGGTGALAINQLVAQALPYLAKFCQVLHLTGKNKKVEIESGEWSGRYHWQEFLVKDIPDAYFLADLIVTRAGMGVLTELSYLGKPIIIIPIPFSHQEKNAQFFQEKDAAVFLEQKKLNPYLFSETIRKILESEEKRKILSLNIQKLAAPLAHQEIVDFILGSLQENKG